MCVPLNSLFTPERSEDMTPADLAMQNTVFQSLYAKYTPQCLGHLEALQDITEDAVVEQWRAGISEQRLLRKADAAVRRPGGRFNAELGVIEALPFTLV